MRKIAAVLGVALCLIAPASAWAQCHVAGMKFEFEPDTEASGQSHRVLIGVAVNPYDDQHTINGYVYIYYHAIGFDGRRLVQTASAPIYQDAPAGEEISIIPIDFFSPYRVADVYDIKFAGLKCEM